MRYQPEDRAGHANIFLAVHGRAGYGLDLLASHELRLLVNGEMVTSSSTYDAAHRAWTFFAATYDAQQAADNVRFYLGGPDQPVRLVGTQTLAAGSTTAHERVFSIGGAPGGIRPFAGALDNLRVFSSQQDNTGALSEKQIEQYRSNDLRFTSADVPSQPVLASPVKGEIVEVRKIWSKAPHNGFPDLVRFKGRWLCVLREAPRHHTTAGGAGRIITSEDGVHWESTDLFVYEGEDVRELRFAITPDDRLMLIGACCAIEGEEEITHSSYVWFSDDGLTWSERQPVENSTYTWTWRATPHEGKIYSAGFRTKDPRYLSLYRSTNGQDWEIYVDRLYQEYFPNESDILFLPDGRAVMLLRRHGGPYTGQLGIAHPPYTEWTWKDLGRRIAAPDLLQLPNGQLIAATRLYEGGTRTALSWVDIERGKLVEFLTLPSRPDTGYAGLEWYDGHLWAAYYSDPAGETSIYFAKVRIEPASSETSFRSK